MRGSSGTAAEPWRTPWQRRRCAGRALADAVRGDLRRNERRMDGQGWTLVRGLALNRALGFREADVLSILEGEPG